MARLRREFGFWGSLGRMQLSDLATPEVIFGVLIGVGLAAALDNVSTQSARVAVAGDYLPIAGALLGIVFAGFALVIALMSDDYIRWLEETDSGVTGFLSPFMVSVGLLVATLIGQWCTGRFAVQLPPTAENVVLRSHQRPLLHRGARYSRSGALGHVPRCSARRGLKIRDLEASQSRPSAQ